MPKSFGHTRYFKEFREIITETDAIADVETQRRFFREPVRADLLKAIAEQMKSAGMTNPDKASETWTDLGLLLKVLKNEYGDFLPVPLRINPCDPLCRGLKACEGEVKNAQIAFDCFRAEELRKAAADGRRFSQYTERHRLLERAIRLVVQWLESDEKWPDNIRMKDNGKTREIARKDACFLVAGCYFDRSELSLPKGAAIPEKKLEALKKAWEWVNTGLKDCDKNTSALKMQIILERDRWDTNFPKDRIRKEIEEFIREYPEEIAKLSDPVHWMFVDRARSYTDGPLLSDIDEKMLARDIPAIDNDTFGYPLCQARAAYRLRVPKLKAKLAQAVDVLKDVPLSHPLWEDTVAFICKLRESDIPDSGWEAQAIRAWKYCRVLEDRIRLSLQLRWYWPRQRDLYDLALDAAIRTGRLKEAADIADSQKSRPTIKMRAIEKSLKRYIITAGAIELMKEDGLPEDVAKKLALYKTRTWHSEEEFVAFFSRNLGDDFETYRKTILRHAGFQNFVNYVQAEALFASGEYLLGIEKLKKISPRKIRTREITDVPNGWAAVHFFLSEEEGGNSHAFVVENGKCGHVPISEDETWQAFCEWERVRQFFHFASENSSAALKNLCKAAGDMLTPVLKEIKAKNIIFIPHGFLHLVPLHAAHITPPEKPEIRTRKFFNIFPRRKTAETEPCGTADNGKKYFFEDYECLFLPSWSLAPTEDRNSETQGDMFLSEWEDEDDLEDLLDEEWHNEKKERNTPDDFFDLIEKGDGPPHMLVFFSHGHGDFVNPYHAGLALCSRLLTHQDLLEQLSAGALNGTRTRLLTHQDLLEQLSAGALNGTRIVLTACETDLVAGRFGKYKTDEHLSLANGFLNRGASEVLGTLYQAEAKASEELILEIKKNTELPLYKTLREQQIEWLKKEDKFYRVPVFRAISFPQTESDSD